MPTEGCWVEVFEDTNFNDKRLIIHGPAEYANLRSLPGAGNENWGDSMGSLRTGPQTWLIAYADENFGDDSIVIGPGSSIPDLADFEDEIDSIKILDHSPTWMFREVLSSLGPKSGRVIP